MIKLLLFVGLIFPCLLSAQPLSDTILWSGKPLTWSNFKGNYDTAVYNRQHLATTLWKLKYEYMPVLSKQQVVFVIDAWFDAARSWVRPKSRRERSLLLHEQGHFDLAELLARQFRKQLSETNFNTANYSNVINNIFNTLLTKAYTQQLTYDKETNYGTNDDRQQYWQNFIASELKRLASYGNKNLVVTLNK